MIDRTKKVLSLFGVVALLGALGGLGLWAIAPGAPAHGPAPIAWDKEPCAHCAMHVGEPAFAAQLQTRDEQVLDFDDPGCLFSYLAERHPDVSAIYFHHFSEDRWLTAEEVAFLHRSPTPMGHGLVAVARGTPGSISLEEARTEVLAHRKQARGDR